MVSKRLFTLLCVVAMGSTLFANELYAAGANPSADRIAKDLIGVKYTETSKDGYFSTQKMMFTEEQNPQVVINDYTMDGADLVYDVTIEFTTSTRGCYYVEGEVTYYRSGSDWKFDMFRCRSIMPRVTNKYNDCISAKIVSESGVGVLVLENNSNIGLGVYLVLYSGYNGEKVVKRAAAVDPNGKRTVGGIFSGLDIKKYEIHYIERT